EDGIRDRNVTGVQTCALPISVHPSREVQNIITNWACGTPSIRRIPPSETNPARIAASTVSAPTKFPIVASFSWSKNVSSETTSQIGRASCRERVEVGVGGGGG